MGLGEDSCVLMGVDSSLVRLEGSSLWGVVDSSLGVVEGSSSLEVGSALLAPIVLSKA